MSTQAEPTGASQPGSAQHDPVLTTPRCVQRVASIPVVADTWEAVHSTILTHVYLAALYGRVGDAASYLYQQSKPLQAVLVGPVSQLDALANKSLDFVQSKAPYIFEVRTEELISKARQPADQAYAYGKTYKDAASARLKPIAEQFHSQLTRSQQTLTALQEKLQSGLQNVRKDPKAVPDQLKHLSEQLVGELGRLSQFVSEKRKELPQQAEQALAPLVERLQKTYSDIKEEFGQADLPLAHRATNVLQYSKDQALPIIHEAIQTLKGMVGSRK